jgi:hypothetical protein
MTHDVTSDHGQFFPAHGAKTLGSFRNNKDSRATLSSLSSFSSVDQSESVHVKGYAEAKQQQEK